MLLSVDPPLQVGDRVRIVCAEWPELCVERSVGSDGTIDVPTLGAVPAAVRRPGELARLISERVRSATLPPRIEVVWVGSSPTEVVVSGAVAHPLRLFAPRGVGCDRLLEAAKPTVDADLALLAPRRRVAPGTTLRVESMSVERQISVLGAVATPRTFPPENGLVLSSALEAAGGLSAHADKDAVLVERRGETIPLVLPADAGFLLQPGDVVRVGLVAVRRYVLVRGMVARPGSIEYAPGMTATQALAAAGGILESAKRGTLVWQTGAKVYRLSVAFLLDRRIPDPVLAASDTLVLESARP